MRKEPLGGCWGQRGSPTLYAKPCIFQEAQPLLHLDSISGRRGKKMEAPFPPWASLTDTSKATPRETPQVGLILEMLWGLPTVDSLYPSLAVSCFPALRHCPMAG